MTASKLPETALEYICRPLYDLSMTLIVGNICKDGIVVTSDRLANATITETGVTFKNHNTPKSFILNNKVLYGVSGTSIEFPEKLDIYVQKLVHADKLDFDEITPYIFATINAYLDILNYPNPSVFLLVAGFNNGVPEIRMASQKDGKVSFTMPAPYGAVGMTKVADERLGKVKYLNILANSMKKKQIEVIGATADEYPEDVGRVTDNFLVTQKGIIKI